MYDEDKTETQGWNVEFLTSTNLEVLTACCVHTLLIILKEEKKTTINKLPLLL